MGGLGPPHSQPAHLGGSPAPGDGAIPAARPPGHGDRFRDQQILAKEPQVHGPSRWMRTREGKWPDPGPSLPCGGAEKGGSPRSRARGGPRALTGVSLQPGCLSRAWMHEPGCFFYCLGWCESDHLSPKTGGVPAEVEKPPASCRGTARPRPRLNTELPHSSCVVMVFSIEIPVRN